MTAPLRRVAVRGLPTHADYVDAGWERLPDLLLAAEQHAALVSALEEAGAQVDVLLPAEGLADACYTYDPVFVTGARHGGAAPGQAVPVRRAAAAGLGAGRARRTRGGPADRRRARRRR